MMTAKMNFGEGPISDVTVALMGEDYRGNAVSLARDRTDEFGVYLFDQLLPGTYTVSETQP